MQDSPSRYLYVQGNKNARDKLTGVVDELLDVASSSKFCVPDILKLFIFESLKILFSRAS